MNGCLMFKINEHPPFYINQHVISNVIPRSYIFNATTYNMFKSLCFMFTSDGIHPVATRKA